jgi:hypothetical protein
VPSFLRRQESRNVLLKKLDARFRGHDCKNTPTCQITSLPKYPNRASFTQQSGQNQIFLLPTGNGAMLLIGFFQERLDKITAS